MNLKESRNEYMEVFVERRENGKMMSLYYNL